MILTFRPLEADTPPFYKHSHFDLSCASSPHLALPVLLFMSTWLRLEIFGKEKRGFSKILSMVSLYILSNNLNILGGKVEPRL